MGYRMLMVSSDNYPVLRVDVEVLFGTEVARRGHSVDLILQSEAACERPYETGWTGGRVWVAATDPGTSLLRRIHKHLLGLRADLRLIAWLRQGRYDALIIKDKFLSGLIGLFTARLCGKAFMFWLSYPFPEAYLEKSRDDSARYPLLYWIRGQAFRVILYRVLLPRADHVFVQSEQMRSDVAREGIPLERMTAVPMGIQPSMFPVEPGRVSRHHLPQGVPCVVYLGTLSRHRHLDFLLRTLRRVRERVPHVRLYFVGRGDVPEDEEFLDQCVRELGLGDAVVMTGQRPRAEALEYVAEADVCVSPFYPSAVLLSASPTKLVEYMAMGKAVVANDHPEQRRVIEESGAGLCVPWEEGAFAEAVVTLLRDPESARRMGALGRDYALAQRSYEVIGRNVEAELSRVIRNVVDSRTT